MKDVLAQNYTLESFQEEEEEEDEEAHRLSFCNLQLMEQNNSGSAHHSPRNSSAQPDHIFEFFAGHSGPVDAISTHNDIVFCGKIIHEDEDDGEEDQLNEYQKRDYFATTKSQSLRRPSFSDSDIAAENRRFSASTRFSGEIAVRPKSPSGNLDYHVQRVNISSLTSMSAKSRRRMFMFGPVKFKPEMELSAIKQRQARRPPADKSAANGGEKSRWGVVRSSLRGRSHLTSVLARSLGCIPVAGAAVGGGVDRRFGVAN